MNSSDPTPIDGSPRQESITQTDVFNSDAAKKFLRHRHLFTIGSLHRNADNESKSTISSQPPLDVNVLQIKTGISNHLDSLGNPPVLRPFNEITSRSRSPTTRYPPSSWKDTFRTNSFAPPTIEETHSNVIRNGHRGGSFMSLAQVSEPEKTRIRTPSHVSETPSPEQKRPRDLQAMSCGLSPSQFPKVVDACSQLPSLNQVSAIVDPFKDRLSASNSAPSTPSHTSSPRRRRYSILSSSFNQTTTTLLSASSRDSNDRKTPSTQAPRPRGPILPDPEIAYDQAYHYVTCPHTSPPVPRPLNIQPTLVQYHESLLVYPPAHLQHFKPSHGMPPPKIYIIEGSCPVCDLSTRRDVESGILDKYSQKLNNLSIQLKLLQKDIGFRQSQPDSVKADVNADIEDLPPEAIQSILEIEDRLEELIKRRDREITFIWRGYTARWGPATLGIYRDNHITRRQRRSQSISERSYPAADRDPTTSSTGIGISAAEPSAERASTITSTISALTSTSASTSQTKSSPGRNRESNGARPRRTRHGSEMSIPSGPREQYSDGTHWINVSSSVDGVKGPGRMVIDWIRPESHVGGSSSSSRSWSRSRMSSQSAR